MYWSSAEKYFNLAFAVIAQSYIAFAYNFIFYNKILALFLMTGTLSNLMQFSLDLIINLLSV